MSGVEMSITYGVWTTGCKYKDSTVVYDCRYCPYKNECLIYRQKRDC
jgi:hypothetical protein